MHLYGRSSRWHTVSVSLHSSQIVEVILDGAIEKMAAQHPDASLDLPPSVYFGGMDVSASTFGRLVDVYHIITA